MHAELPETRAKPFLRWAGGKGKLVPELLKYAPTSFQTYHECFLGGGAFFFALQPHHAILSDANVELINAYKQVRNQHSELIIELQRHAAAHGKDYYLAVRARNPTLLEPVERAAWFIYLNGASFNGLYRVNKSGQFNVPWDPGRSGSVNEDTLARASDVLITRAHVLATDFRTVEERVAPGDLLYADPPYVPISATADFTSYTADRFTYQDQVDLRDLALRLKRKGVHVLLSNSGTEAVRQLYQAHFELIPVEARRNINCKAGKRGPVGEYIIR